MSINFDDKKIKKNSFYKDKNTLNTLLAIMIMISLDHYV